MAWKYFDGERRETLYKSGTIVKDERFELKGRVESPQAFMLITNNMEIQTKNPGMKIKWTYTDLFVENTEISITSGAYSELDSKSKLQVKGGQAHQDYEEFMNMKGVIGNGILSIPTLDQ